jgi:flagellar hook protein FlgE
MSFTTALSGLNAAANYLSVLGNNIANVNTTGFKLSRSQFVDVYAHSISGMNNTQIGGGVRVAEVAQQFTQGNLDWTGNSLDMAINGEGFFTLATNPADLGSRVYSRAGAFEVNKDGLVTNSQGQALLAYKPNGTTVANGFSTGVLTTVSLNVGSGLSAATTKVDLGVNLDASKPAITANTTTTVASGAFSGGVVSGTTTGSSSYSFKVDGVEAISAIQDAGGSGAIVTAAQMDTKMTDWLATAAGKGYSMTGTFAAGTAKITKTDGTALTLAQTIAPGIGATITPPTFAGAGFIGTTTPTPPFSPQNSATYTTQTSTTVYDSLGASHSLTTYFVAGTTTMGTPPTRNWTVHHYITDDPANPVSINLDGKPATLTFDSTGKLTAPANGQVQLAPYVSGTSAAPITINMNYGGSTQFASTFNVNTLKQDGLATGTLTGINVDETGVIFALFSNGSSTPLGQVAITQFANPQGLSKLGDTTWGQSSDSGAPISGESGTGSFGLIQSGALEQSNVNLTAQLVNLITAQQAYQANAKTISTENTIIDTILNIR